MIIIIIISFLVVSDKGDSINNYCPGDGMDLMWLANPNLVLKMRSHVAQWSYPDGLRETKWKGSKSKDIGNDYQVIYHGTDNKRNGVAIVLDNNFKARIINITRKSDRLIAIKLALDDQQITNIISAYAPQSGCTDVEKSDFWDDFDDLIRSIPINKYKIIGGDLNGHVGVSNTAYEKTVHGGYGMGEVNKQGETILDFAARHSLSLINTNFQKKLEHLITYKCAGKVSQIDFIVSVR
ncbi:craniofacial development protein 2-like [Leguminivora glycinivorella]|uniref:craniofacial development protein 2-like n=1 Tax=Leguminivora glycinivorella TaxID=1035111 RepID=UPI00200DED79|nr:craniofacial development protein 2-like [Leguminivora glycinivorella]